jgi:hypothetical protein
MTNTRVADLLLFIAFCLAVLVFLLIRPASGVAVFASSALLYIVYSLYTIWQIKKNGIETAGNIIEIERNTNGNYTPVVEFFISPDEKITGKPFISSSFNVSGLKLTSTELRETRVIYHRKKPSQFLLPEFATQNTFFIVIAIAVCLLLIFFGFSNYSP